MAPPSFNHAGESVTVAGETLLLLPEKAVFWPARRTLILADLHLGKDTTFRGAGLAVPPRVTGSDLEDIRRVVGRLPCQRILILGDFVHHRTSLGPRLTRELVSWRAKLRVDSVDLIPGNHDKHAGIHDVPAGFRLLDDVVGDGPFVFSHHPEATDRGFVIAGHLHPVVVLRGRGADSLRVPCFLLERSVLTLPAFGSFTGGFEIDRTGEHEIYAVAGRSVLRVPRGTVR